MYLSQFRNELHPDSASIVAFIRFKTREEAEEAAKGTNGKELDGHHLTVDLADNTKKDNKRAVFLGNLHLRKSAFYGAPARM
jgi:RNA recognition motif-containing protein